MARMTNVELLDAALEKVESESIREWANTASNRPVWEKIAQNTVDKKGDDADPVAFSAYVVCQAIGL